MPMPITIEMNITEKSERCPITSVAMPIDQQRLVARTRSISTGLPRRTKAASRSPSVSANASRVARSLARNAATISSFWSAGLAVTPTATSGQRVERRSGRERLNDLLVVEDRVADVGEPFLRQVEQAAPLELLGIDPVGDPLQRHVVGPELPDETVRVERRLRQRGRVHDDGDAVQVAELAVVLGVALDVGLARRQQGARRGGEGEVLERVDDRQDRQDELDEDGRDGPRTGESDQRAERATDQTSDRHLLVAGDEPLEPLPGGVVGPLLGGGPHQVRRRSVEGALDPAIERELAGPDG